MAGALPPPTPDGGAAAAAGHPSYKIIVVGESGVGKSALTLRLTDSVFYSDFAPTIAIDFRVHAMTLDGEVIRLQIWDTAGQECFHAVASSFYRSADGVLLCFDITDRNSFLALPQWLRRVREHAPHVSPCVVVGCKSDLQSRRVVQGEEANAWTVAHQGEGVAGYIETSALEADNVELAFQQIVCSIRDTAARAGKDEAAFHAAFNTRGGLPAKSRSQQRRGRCCA
eukprot:TRINITY_DN3166_c0_g6_i1.p1 TRINITY_DN3166_c0_g6~~TRINITY_DN3166_c0_g6_i1.p1  ORF type:complete len:227 (+),score=75.37 TRINITY_DN3166_c0_g6_i1:71-751(+)